MVIKICLSLVYKGQSCSLICQHPVDNSNIVIYTRMIYILEPPTLLAYDNIEPTPLRRHTMESYKFQQNLPLKAAKFVTTYRHVMSAYWIACILFNNCLEIQINPQLWRRTALLYCSVLNKGIIKAF